MFIPLDRKPNWRRPPFITLLLISINILVFIFLQAQDQLREDDAFRYYFSSGLAELEMPRYIQYLNQQGGTQLAIVPVDELAADKQKILYHHLLANGSFLQALNTSHIIRSNDPDYAVWLGLRRGFDNRLQNIFSYRYSLKPHSPSTLSLISSLFLHANSWHLLGNMIFLLLFGFILELSLGSGILLLVFMACGISANLVTIAITPNSAQWIMGASGAITGLASLYAILYGMRKIRFFYSLIIYFDYVRAPAIIMLPAWLIYELTYSLISPNSVSTVTHIGGLLSGILIGGIIKCSPLKIHAEENKENVSIDFETEYQNAMSALSNADLQKASELLKRLLENQPEDSRILVKLFQIAKARNDLPSAQRYIQLLLTLTEHDSQLVREQQRSFLDYLQLTKGEDKLPAELLTKTAIRFCGAGFIEDSENILALLLKQNPSAKSIPALLFSLSTRYHKSGNIEKSNHYKSLLTQHFADSPEAQSIQQILPMSN